jgi:proteasome lid subunit RPN8/RPN11
MKENIMLKITQSIRNALVQVSRHAAPLEACGLLGGVDTVVSEFYELSNIDASGEHYSMNPEEQFAAVKDMRIKGLRMLAIWHSHPETPARMSDEDLRLAYTPGVAYVIVSLAQVDKPSVRGFVVKDGAPEEVEVRIVPDSSSTDQ